MGNVKKNVESFYSLNVLKANAKFKETSKSLGGASKVLLSGAKEIDLNETWLKFLKLALDNNVRNEEKQKQAYKLLAEICKPNHISEKFSPFYILQGLKRGNSKINELINGKKASPKAEGMKPSLGVSREQNNLQNK